MAIAPSVLLHKYTIYEADGLVFLFKKTTFERWAIPGRVLTFPMLSFTAAYLPKYPFAARILSAVYITLFAGFVSLLILVGRYFFSSYVASVFWVTLITTHFHFLPVRGYNGFISIAASNVQLLGFLGSLFLSHRFSRLRLWICCVPLVISTFIALNLHQAGAFIPLSILGLAFYAAFLQGETFYSIFLKP